MDFFIDFCYKVEKISVFSWFVESFPHNWLLNFINIISSSRCLLDTSIEPLGKRECELKYYPDQTDMWAPLRGIFLIAN